MSKRQLKKAVMAEALRLMRAEYGVRQFELIDDGSKSGHIGYIWLSEPHAHLTHLKNLCDRLEGRKPNWYAK